MKPAKEKKPLPKETPAVDLGDGGDKPELLSDKPRKGRPPGSKTKHPTKVRIPIARLFDVPVYMDKDGKLLSPKDPGLLLKQDPTRSTVKQIAPLLPLDGVSWLVSRGKDRPALRTYYPAPGVALIQECFNALVESLGPDIHPGWALLICYALTLGAAVMAYNMDAPKKGTDGTDKRDASGAGHPEDAAGRGADNRGSGKAGDGEDHSLALVRREDGAETPRA
jgi:hypothetical protein